MARPLKFAVLSVTVFLAGLPAVAQRADDSIPRLPNGKPDLSGVWDHPAPINLARAANECGSITKELQAYFRRLRFPSRPSALPSGATRRVM